MRFENWDVLLFPEESRAPIQEFKTQCFVTKDVESAFLQSHSLLIPSSLHLTGNQATSSQVPIMTTFIPSMARNSVFRVSLHCWDTPRPTKVAESLMQPDDSLLYEARIFIDGQCVSGNLISPRHQWPYVIDFSNQIDKNGNQDNLRFPPFHEELLQDCHWDASEPYGRIRVVLSEGFARQHRSPPFERVRDLIIFSFQHAPLHVLECTSIAWPNPGMWQQAPRHLLKYNVAANHSLTRERDEDAHSHSPTRPDGRACGTQHASRKSEYPVWPYRLYPTPPMAWQGGSSWPERESRWGAPSPPAFSDPFLEPYREPVLSRRNRSTLSDVPMPDYNGSSSSSSRAISNMTGISFGHSKQASVIAAPDDEQYNQLIEALSPKKHSSGTQPPTNTPSVPPVVLKPSTDVEINIEPLHRNSKPTEKPKETSLPVTKRGASGSSVSFEVPNEDSADENAPLPAPLLSPSPHVKGKKEGHSKRRSHGSSEAGRRSKVSSPRHGSDQQNDDGSRLAIRVASSVVSSTESKRKRSDMLDTSHIKGISSVESNSPSPSKKLSRRDECDDHPHEIMQELLGRKASSFTGNDGSPD